MLNLHTARTLVCLACLAPFGAGAQALPEKRNLDLSLSDAIALALERNYTVRIQRLEPEIAQQDVRAASGLFDPELNAEYLYSNNEYEGFAIDEENAEASVGVGGILPWGTEYGLELRGSDRTTPFSEPDSSFGSGLNSFAGIVVTQPILRGIGFNNPAYAQLRLARNNEVISHEIFRSILIDTVTETVLAYTDYYVAGQSYEIARRNRDLAAQLLEDNRKRVETGSMAPIDLVQAESEVALRRVTVISSELALKNAENRLKGIIFADPQSILQYSISIDPPDDPKRIEIDRAIDFATALAKRPDYRATELDLANREIELRRERNSALPSLDLIGSYGRRGFDTESMSDSWDNLRDEGRDAYSIGAVFNFPIPNRTRDANRVAAYLRRNQSELVLNQLEQDILIQVDNVANRVSADWNRVVAARRARELAERSLTAEEKKLQAGTSTTFIVLRLQGDLATAEVRELLALADYQNSVAEYYRTLGTTLERLNIQVQ